MVAFPGSDSPAIVPGFDDFAVVSDPVEQGRGHLAVAKHLRPFAEGQVSGNEQRGALVEPSDEVGQFLMPISLKGGSFLRAG